MIYLITCRKCDFSTNTDDPKKVKFCGGCGSFLGIIKANKPQPFHLEDKDVQDLMKVDKVLKECNDILKRINEKDSPNREETRKMLDKIKEDGKDRILKSPEFKPIYKDYDSAREAWILNDVKWFEKLKKLKF